jgi:sugar phosphate permease
VLGVAVGAAILGGRISDHTRELGKSFPPHLVRRDALILSVHDAFYVAAAICVLGALASMIRGRGRPEDAGSGSPSGSRRDSQGKAVNQSRGAEVYSPLDQEQL